MRQPVPPGTIPIPKPLSVDDEQYGHDVLSQLTEKYPLSQDDAKIERARRLVSRLTDAAQASGDPWHVYVLTDPTIKNAAATKGNHIFVWTGMLDTLTNDNELSVVIAHEIAHVLADHANISANEEASQLISQVAGAVTQNALIYNGSVGALANIAAALTQETLGALLINPESQRKELEADLIGIHLMAEAGIDPRIALAFWEKNLNNSDFTSGLPQFFSSHPSSKERLKLIKINLDGAMRRYERKTGTRSQTLSNQKDSWTYDVPKRSSPNSIAPAVNNYKKTSSSNYNNSAIGETWIVADNNADVIKAPASNSQRVKTLPKGARVTVTGRSGRWLKITSPLDGFIWGPKLSPIN